jgi:hypothetical protein
MAIMKKCVEPLGDVIFNDLMSIVTRLMQIKPSSFLSFPNQIKVKF